MQKAVVSNSMQSEQQHPSTLHVAYTTLTLALLHILLAVAVAVALHMALHMVVALLVVVLAVVVALHMVVVLAVVALEPCLAWGRWLRPCAQRTQTPPTSHGWTPWTASSPTSLRQETPTAAC